MKTANIEITGAVGEGNIFIFHLADFRDYADTQERVAKLHQDRPAWAPRAVLNVARMGRFSSDRTVREYADEAWGLEPVPVAVGKPGVREGASA